MSDPQPEPDDATTRWTRRLGLLLVVVTAATWLPVLGADFVWDDRVLVLDNKLLTEPGHLLDLLRADLWAGTPAAVERSGFHRPLVTLSFALDRALTGPAAWFAHLHSLCWHLLGAWALLSLLRRVVHPAAALAGTAIFLLHPAQVEAVAWVAARNDPMAAALLLLGILLVDDDAAGPGRLLVGALCVIGALLSKESAILAPLVLAGFAWARTGRLGRLRAHLAVLAAVGSWLAIRAWSGVPLPARADAEHLRAAVLPALASLSRSLVWPVHLAPGVHLAWPPPVPWPALVAALALAVLLALRGGRAALAGLCVAAATLAPALAAVASQGLVADRYLYLPLAGISLAVAAALSATPRAALFIGGGLIAAGAIGTASTLPTWRSDLDLWRAAVAAHPSQWTAGALARTLDLGGRPAEAITWYRRAIAPPLAMQEACYRVTAVDLAMGDLPAAIADADAGLQAGCARTPELLAPVALAYAGLGEWDRAEALAAELDPDPTGLSVVVRAAAGARRGDLAPLRAALAAHPDADPAGLYAQVAWLLERSGEAEAAAAVRAAAP